MSNSRSLVELEPTNLALSASGATAIILGYVISNDVQDTFGYHDKFDDWPSDQNLQNSNEELMSFMNFMATSSSEKKTTHGAVRETRTTYNISVARIKAIKNVGIALIVIGWVLVALAVALNFGNENSIYSTGMSTTMLMASGIMCGITLLRGYTATSKSMVVSGGSRMLYIGSWFAYAVGIGFSGGDGKLDVDRLLLAIAGSIFMTFSDVLVGFDRKCCDVEDSKNPKMPDKLVRRKSGGSVFNLGIPLYCIGWLFIVFAISLAD